MASPLVPHIHMWTLWHERVLNLSKMTSNRYCSLNLTLLYFHWPDGRYKKEVMVDGQSRVLLVRDITSSPPTQVFWESVDTAFVRCWACFSPTRKLLPPEFLSWNSNFLKWSRFLWCQWNVFSCTRVFCVKVCHWADGFMLVFSVCDELSYNLLHSFYSRITECRGGKHQARPPVVLIGTQGTVVLVLAGEKKRHWEREGVVTERKSVS